MKKRAQSIMGMSFGTIFAIILVVAILAVSFYVISYFLGLNKCTEIGFFYRDLQDEITKGWSTGSRYVDVFEGTLPQSGFIRTGLETVEFEAGQEDIRINLYPENRACDGTLATNIIHHANVPASFTVPIENGKVRIQLTKEIRDDLVTITAP